MITLMLIEIPYVLWVITMMIAIAQEGPDNKRSTTNTDAIKLIAGGMILAYIPRLIYFRKLCGYNCSSKPDTSSQRYNLVVAMNALILS